MAPAKKAAPRKVTRKKTATKKAVSSKSVKKTTKKTTKKVAKKVVKKTTKKAVQKTVSKERTRSERTSFDSKLKSVSALKTKVKSESAPKPSKLRLKKPALQNTMGLAVLSASSFPANLDMLAIQTARVSGVAFVILGGIFALNYSQLVWNEDVIAQHAHYQKAQTGSFNPYNSGGTSGGGGNYNPYNSGGTGGNNASYNPFNQQDDTPVDDPDPVNGVQSTGNTSGSNNASGSGGTSYNPYDDGTDWQDIAGTAGQGGSEEDTTVPGQTLQSGNPENPSVNIEVQNDGGVVRETVDVFITVEGVERVEVYASASWNSDDIFLGEADLTSEPDVWLFPWNTTNLDDGRYTIKARVFNQFNPDGYLDSGLSYDVNNTDQVASTQPVGSNPEAAIELLTDQPVDDVAEFEVDVDDASEVRLAYRSPTGGPLQNISGLATQEDSFTWSHTWDTANLPEGRYQVVARVINEATNNKYTSNPIIVEIKHEAEEEIVEEEIVEDSVIEEETVEEDEVVQSQLPPVEVFVSNDTLQGNSLLRVRTPGAQRVRLFAREAGSTRNFDIGAAQKSTRESGLWALNWNTNNTPNGEYEIYAKVTNVLGTYDSESVEVAVDNVVVYETTDEQEQDKVVLQDAAEVGEEIERVNPILRPNTPAPPETTATESGVESVEVANDEEDAPETPQEQRERERAERAAALVSEFYEELDDELQRFAAAYRSRDDDRIAAATQRVENLKQEIVVRLRGDDEDELLNEINKRVDDIIEDYKERIEEVDTIIAERVSQEVFKDSDRDGITDFDEVAIFNTDPFSADSDGDGFNDGAEIESGFDPTDSRREVAVAFESPKERGVVRADILRVDRVEPVVEKVVDPTVGVEEEEVFADISGVALPNSFVTIYIFSTPIVVTVKTDEDGAWRYRFDKELEDGEHNVFVGVTDNAGRIVAKSEPFTFVKEAQAFSPVDAAVAGAGQVDTGAPESSLLSQYMVYLIISISVVSIGLVLILLGLHLDSRGRRNNPEIVNSET